MQAAFGILVTANHVVVTRSRNVTLGKPRAKETELVHSFLEREEGLTPIRHKLKFLIRATPFYR